MKSKIGLVFGHIYVESGQEYKFDILEYCIKYFKKSDIDFYYVVSGHGIELPNTILELIDGYYWERAIDHKQIGRGHPKFCIEAMKILMNNKVDKFLKLRGWEIILELEKFKDLLSKNKICLSEQTSLSLGMIGDLLMFGNTDKIYEMWTEKPWDYEKSGLYNLYDNLNLISEKNHSNIEEYLKENFIFVNPGEIRWVSVEHNWDIDKKMIIEEFSNKHLWGKKEGHGYYGGF